MIPTIGRIVLYCLSEKDVDAINRRRTNSASISYRLGAGDWPEGAQAHIGNVARTGQEFPMMIVRVDPTATAVHGQVFLDGNDVLWIHAEHGLENGTWRWPGEVLLDDSNPLKRRSNCF